MDTRLVATRERILFSGTGARERLARPPWIDRSRLLIDAHAVAAASHGDQRRPSDGRYFLEHVVEVGQLLDDAGFDDELIAVGLLHDTVERGTLTEKDLRAEMGASIGALVLTLSENPMIASFDRRKAGLRRQVESGGRLAVTVYAADKLSDLRGLRRGIGIYGEALEERLGTSVGSMAAHYRESVEMIGTVRSSSVFLAPLRQELERLQDQVRKEVGV
jgi:hypothetical protein